MTRHTFDGPFCRKQRKLAKCWRAIARRWRDKPLRSLIVNYHVGDDAAGK